MATQNAIVVSAVGEPVTSVTNWPIPQPGPKQIQVRVTVTGLNPHDQKSRDIGLFVKDSLPAILGSDVVGIVSQLGEGATRYKIGDRIFGQASLSPDSTQRALQEYAVLEEDFTAHVPDGMSDDDAATLPTNLLAGLIGFFDVDGLALTAPWNSEIDQSKVSSSTILIIGGGSNCGRFATQLACLAGFGTIVVVGGNDAELTKFGATHIVSRHGDHDTVLKRVRDVVGDDLIYAFDAYNAPADQHLAINALPNSRTGKLARLLSSRGSVQEDKIHSKKAGYELKDILGLSHIKSAVAGPFWRHATELLTEGKIQPLEYATVQGLNVDKVNEVLDRYRDGKKVEQPHFRISE